MAYNVAGAPRADTIIVNASLHQAGDTVRCLDGGTGTVAVERAPNGAALVRVSLAPHQFVVLA